MIHQFPNPRLRRLETHNGLWIEDVISHEELGNARRLSLDFRSVLGVLLGWSDSCVFPHLLEINLYNGSRLSQ